MLNNKYLAIILSIVALVVVVYQLFINKPDRQGEPKYNESYSAPGPPGSSGGSTGNTANLPPSTPAVDTGQESQDMESPELPSRQPDQEGNIIDYSSELLLKRIPPEMIQRYPRQELEDEYGSSIFSQGEKAPTSPSEDNSVREVEFTLNGIIIDDQRRMAIINEKILNIGDVIQGAEVMAIVKSKVVLKINNETIVLSTNSRVKKVRLIGGNRGR